MSINYRCRYKWLSRSNDRRIRFEPSAASHRYLRKQRHQSADPTQPNPTSGMRDWCISAMRRRVCADRPVRRGPRVSDGEFHPSMRSRTTALSLIKLILPAVRRSVGRSVRLYVHLSITETAKTRCHGIPNRRPSWLYYLEEFAIVEV